jgi:hypothetical protein
MALIFPNVSRSYDETRKCVRFWGYDGTFEITFLVDVDALSKLQKVTSLTDGAVLSTFDLWRGRIMMVASSAYRGNRQSLYRLAAADF